MKHHFSSAIEGTMRRYHAGLNEKDRRLYAGLEALKIGRGGCAYIAKASWMQSEYREQGCA